MDETRRSDGDGTEPELVRPEDAIKDLEPSVEDGDAVAGGALNAYIKLEGVE